MRRKDALLRVIIHVWNIPTAFSSMIFCALVLAADMASGDGEAKNWRMKFMEGGFELR